MINLIQSGEIVIKNGFQSVLYVLEDDRLFMISGYKLMKARESSGLLKCSRIQLNGKTALCYQTGEMKPLDRMFGFLSFEAFLTIMQKVIDIILEVEGNGFLQACNLDLSFDRIFVESKHLDAGVVYLPINNKNAASRDPEMDFRKSLYEQIRQLPLYFSQAAEMVCQNLMDGTRTLRDVKAVMAQVSRTQSGEPEVYKVERRRDGTKTLAANLRLISQSRQYPVTLHDHSYEYVIGKHGAQAEGVIPVSSVSRKHCVIYFSNGEYYIEDLDSTNGTRVNGVRLPSHQRKRIFNGDVVSIANIPFKIEC